MWWRTVRQDLRAGECRAVHRCPAANLPSLTPLFPSSSYQTSAAVRATGILRKKTGPLTTSAATAATLGGFVHEGDPFARVPSRASATRAPPPARSRRPAPVLTPPSTSATPKRRPTMTTTSSPSGGTPLTSPLLARAARSAAVRARQVPQVP